MKTFSSKVELTCERPGGCRYCVDIIIPHAYGAIGTRTILNRWSKDKGVVTLGRKLFILLLSVVFLTGQWGCATGPYGYPKPEPLSEEYRGQLGTIGVATGPDVPVIEIDTHPPAIASTTPGVFTRMGQGASDGAENSWDWWSDNVLGNEAFEALIAIPPLAVAVALSALILIVPVTIFGGLGGAIGGLASDEPSGTVYTEYVEENEARLRDSLAEYPIQEYFQRAFLKEARARTAHTFVVISEEGPQSDEGMVGQGVDTVLELSVQRIWLKRLAEVEGDTNPPMVVVLVVRVKLVRATEKTEWYDQTFVHETEKGPYDWWVHPIRFQGAIEKAYQDLAEQMVNELFITTQPSQQS